MIAMPPPEPQTWLPEPESDVVTVAAPLAGSLRVQLNVSS